jgi:hypothetical protein
MTHPTFETNEQYWRWFEQKQQRKILNDYFGESQCIIPILNNQEAKMVDITQYTKAMGTFLKAEAVKLHPQVPFIILMEGRMEKNAKFGIEKLRLEGEFNGQESIVDISKTNARAIEKKLGSDTKKWIGHQVFFETYKTKTSDGKMVDALNVREII